MKKFLCLLTGLLIVFSCCINVCADDGISVYVNRVELQFDVEPTIIEGRTMVPLRAIFEALGASVQWDGETRSVTSVKGGTTVHLTVDNNVMRVNGIDKTLDVPARIISDRTLVPVRAISEAFDCGVEWINETRSVMIYTSTNVLVDVTSIPSYTTSPYAVVNNNVPFFDVNEFSPNSFEYYSENDRLSRAGTALAVVGLDLMPTEEREALSSVTPSGWHSTKYDVVDGGYLYNRCHLIGFQLSGENANEKNLITGTRYLNMEGMLPFENMIADYIKETNNHVIYRVTPAYMGTELVARGVLLEAYSIEDEGEGILFNVFCYNVQPGVYINYADGQSSLNGVFETQESEIVTGYILNTRSMKFHEMDCGTGQRTKAEYKEETNLDRETLINKGYTPCGNCNP